MTAKTSHPTMVKLEAIDACDMPVFLEQHFNWLNAQSEAPVELMVIEDDDKPA